MKQSHIKHFIHFFKNILKQIFTENIPEQTQTSDLLFSKEHGTKIATRCSGMKIAAQRVFVCVCAAEAASVNPGNLPSLSISQSTRSVSLPVCQSDYPRLFPHCLPPVCLSPHCLSVSLRHSPLLSVSLNSFRYFVLHFRYCSRNDLIGLYNLLTYLSKVSIPSYVCRGHCGVLGEARTSSSACKSTGMSLTLVGCRGGSMPSDPQWLSGKCSGL